MAIFSFIVYAGIAVSYNEFVKIIFCIIDRLVIFILRKTLFMKRVFLASIFVAGISSMFLACNNGAYNANPTSNSADILNPLNPSSGVTIPFGRVQAAINGSLRVFEPGKWTDSVAGTTTFWAVKYDNTHTTEFIGASMSPFKGAPQHYYVFDSLSNDIFYGVMDTTNNSIYSYYEGKIATGYSGFGDIYVKGTESGHLRGVFSGSLYKVLPQLDFGDVIQVGNGEFYVGKK